MRSLSETTPGDLKLARESADVLLRFKAYLPPGGLLLMLVGKFRDDVLDALDVEPEGLPRRGRERRSLDELTSVELDTVVAATGILCDRFTAHMDDPALPRLLGEFRDALRQQKAERKQIRASIATSA